MTHTYSRSFATRLSIYILSFTLIVFATIMGLFYKYSHEKVTNYAIERTHGLLSNIAGIFRCQERTKLKKVWY